MKKVGSLLIALVMSISLLIGCGQQAASTSASGAASTASGSAAAGSSTENYPDYLNPPGVYPITKEKIKLSVFIVATGIGDDFEYEKNAFTKWLTDKSNIELEFVVVNSVDAKEKLRLMMVSGEYPDIIFRSAFTLSEQQNYGNQGFIIPLNDLVKNYCVNIPKMFEEYPLAQELFTLGNGEMYDIPSVNECYHCSVVQKMWVYKPWLDALNLDIPTTTEEFYDMLVQFRDKDPNGNGIKDEIPLACSPKGWETRLEGFLMQPFAASTTSTGKVDKYINNGKVTVGFTSEEYREGLRFLKKLYDEGLVAPESLTQDDKQLAQMGSNPGVNILGCAPGGYQGSFTTMGENTGWEDWVTIPALKGPNGRQAAKCNPYGNYYTSFCITDKCKYPEAAIRLADLMIEPEATTRNVYGIEGEDWEWITSGKEIGINGKPAVIRLFENVAPKNHSWNQSGITFRTSDFRLGMPETPDSLMETILYKESETNYYPYIKDESTLIPPLPFSEDAATELSMYESPVSDYVHEMVARFITGASDLDKDWENYLTELDNIGLSRMLEIYQEAYDAR